jgi:hypothetical protein
MQVNGLKIKKGTRRILNEYNWEKIRPLYNSLRFGVWGRETHETMEELNAVIVMTIMNRVRLEALIEISSRQGIPRVCGKRRFITMLISIRHWTSSWARWIQSTSSYPNFKTHFDIILPSLPSFLLQFCKRFMSLLCVLHTITYLILLDLTVLISNFWREKVIKLQNMQFPSPFCHFLSLIDPHIHLNTVSYANILSVCAKIVSGDQPRQYCVKDQRFGNLFFLFRQGWRGWWSEKISVHIFSVHPAYTVAWEVILTLILSKRFTYSFVLFHCTKSLIRSRYYILFLVPVFVVQVTKYSCCSSV